MGKQKTLKQLELQQMGAARGGSEQPKPKVIVQIIPRA